MGAKIPHDFIWQNGGATFMARLVGGGGNYLTIAAVTSITCKVFDLDGATPTVAVATPTISSVASVLSNSLTVPSATDFRWKIDAIGFNFLHTIPGTAFTAAKHRYRIEYKFLASGDYFFLVFEVVAERTFS